MSELITKLQSVLNQYKHELEKSLNDKSMPWHKGMVIIERKTNISKFYQFLFAAAFCIYYLICGRNAQLLCNIIGVIYPIYNSIRNIESSSKLDDTKWCTYWVTYGIMSVIEYFSAILAFVIPFYWLLKCLFLIWCMLPIEQNGSYVIYTRVILPHFLRGNN